MHSDPNPFEKYPDLWPTCIHSLSFIMGKAIQGRLTENKKKEHQKVVDFCEHFEREEFGEAAGLFFKMSKPFRNIIPESFVRKLKQEGKFKIFNNASK